MSEIIFISCPHYSIMCRNIQITRKAQIEFGYVSLVLIWTSSNLVIIMSEFFFICSPSQPAYNDVLVSDPNSRCQQYTVLVFFSRIFTPNSFYIPYFLIQFPRKLFFFGLGNPKVTVHKCAETIQGRKLYEEIRYVVCILQKPRQC